VVMTLLALFVHYHVQWIRRRHALIDSGEVRPFRGFGKLTEAPGLLPIFGEKGHGLIHVSAKSVDNYWKIVEVFPEAKVL
jgi:hypothetical protein